MDIRRENFKRIAENRTNKVINLIELLGNLSNKSYYDYTEEEVEKIFKTIQITLNIQRDKFKSKTHRRKKFTL